MNRLVSFVTRTYQSSCIVGRVCASKQNVPISRYSTYNKDISADCHHRCRQNSVMRWVTKNKLEKCRSFTTTAVVKESFNVQDTEDFKQRVLNSDKPVVVDFHATWCGPCKTLAPRLEAIVASKGDKIHLAKVDIDNNTDLAMEYGVKSVPSVFGMKGGKAIDQFIGVIDDDKIHSFIDKLIGPSV